MTNRIGILGGGAWGTALALVAARAGNDVTLWARDAETVAAINARRQNPRHLPGVTLNADFRATGNLSEAAGAGIVVLAVPAQTLRAVAAEAAAQVTGGARIVIAAKGLERTTGKRPSEIVAQTLPGANVAVLSGPSFARDVALGLPTAVTIAAADEARALDLCRTFSTPAFRPYAETDVVGVEIGGAVKNVLAIAAGIVAGRKLGASALAALVARGFAELRRLAETLGARPETLMGLSGLGDLMLTCSSVQSRNFSYGIALGSGSKADPHQLVEGRETAAIARDIAAQRGVDVPIVAAVAAVIAGHLTVDTAIEGLMARPLKRESA